MTIFVLILLSFLTFVSRVVNLSNIPIFTDEAIYIRWAQIGLADPAHRFISLTDGKQPLFTWAMYPMLKLFSDPLFAGRFVSVLSGVFTVIGIYLLARQLFSFRTAWLAALIYIFSPFAFIYDRLALMDSLLSSFAVWSLYLEVLLVTHLRLDLALLLGMTIGFGLLTKSSAFFYLYLLPFSLILLDRRKINKRILIKWLGLICISIIISLTIYNSLRLSPWFYIIEQKNHVFITTFSEFIKSPFKMLGGNLRGLFEILYVYLTPTFSIILLFSLTMMFFKRKNKQVLLLTWFFLPFITLAFFGLIIFPRFILFMVVPLFIHIADGLDQLMQMMSKKAKYHYLLLLLFFVYPLYQIYLLSVNPVQATIPSADRKQFFDDWPSGYGVNEVVAYLKGKAETGRVVIGTEGTFGLNPAVYEIYFGLNPNVKIYGFWPVSEVPKILLESSIHTDTYLIFKEKQDIPPSWPLKLIKKIRRGKSDTHLLFYQVIP